MLTMEELKIIVFSLLKSSVVSLVALVVGAYFLLRRNPRIKFHLEKLGGPKTTPVLGNAIQLWIPHNDLIPLLGDWFKQHGTTYRFWIGNLVPYVMTSDVYVIEKLVTSQIEKGKYDYVLFEPWLGTGLLTAPVSKWSFRRKLLTPSFHFRIMEDFIPIFNEQANVFLDCLKKDGHSGSDQSFNMYPYITKCTLDIICETAMGKNIHAQTSDSNKKYVDAVNGMCSVIIDKMLKPWLRVPGIYHVSSVARLEKRVLPILRNFTEEVIQARKLERRKNPDDDDGLEAGTSAGTTKSSENLGIYGKHRKAFLDLLLDTAENTRQLTDDDIREEVDTFMFEGHDTTGVNLSWTVLLLAMHPECQRLVQMELDQVLSGSSAHDITSAEISKLKYLECCVKESLRLFPSVPFIMRQIMSDVKLDDGRIIPKGATAMISIFFLHRQAEHFSDPEKFIPERWSTELSVSDTKRHPFAYIPFSAGSRNCIGQKFAMLEEKIFLAKLFKEYRVETSECYDDLQPTPDVVLRCENGVHVKLLKR